MNVVNLFDILYIRSHMRLTPRYCSSMFSSLLLTLNCSISLPLEVNRILANVRRHSQKAKEGLVRLCLSIRLAWSGFAFLAFLPVGLNQ